MAARKRTRLSYVAQQSEFAPGTTVRGFLFFDLARDMSLADTSVLYVPDAVVIPGNKPLMFFEVRLAKPGK